jgi:hypothetical protein
MFKGAKPADLPVEQPTKFELLVSAAAEQSCGRAPGDALDEIKLEWTYTEQRFAFFFGKSADGPVRCAWEHTGKFMSDTEPPGPKC